MMKEINLQKILFDAIPEEIKNEGFGFGDVDEKYILSAMKEACKQTLELAAENANYGVYQNDDGQEPWIHESNIFVNKQSILDTIDQIE